jgi:hypothetical protein
MTASATSSGPGEQPARASSRAWFAPRQAQSASACVSSRRPLYFLLEGLEQIVGHVRRLADGELDALELLKAYLELNPTPTRDSDTLCPIITF